MKLIRLSQHLMMKLMHCCLMRLRIPKKKSALAEAIGAKHKARNQIKTARRTFAQAKPTVKQLKLSR